MADQMKAHTPVGLEARRLAMGLSREALGAASGGISSATITRIERRRVRPHPATLAALARVLGVECPRDLLNDHDPAGNGAVERKGDAGARPKP